MTVVILVPVTRRVAISLPDRLYERIERARRSAGQDRSRWLQEAAGEYLARVDEDARVKAYFEGYERIPDDDEDSSGVADYSIRRLRRGR